jgi:hypothetical protein
LAELKALGLLYHKVGDAGWRRQELGTLSMPARRKLAER